MKNIIYNLQNIQYYYGKIKALHIDSLEIEYKKITGLIGPNGSGKTTFLKLLSFALPFAGFQFANNNQKKSKKGIFYKGIKREVFPQNLRTQITLLPQKPYLLKRSVFDNIVYGLKVRKDNKNIEKRVKQVLWDIGLDYKKFAHRQWNQISGGEAQRVAMAARLILKPEVLLLDEPTSSVDTKSAQLIRQASLKAIDDWGASLVIASHDLQWLYLISDKQLSIFNGIVYHTGSQNIITGPFKKLDNEKCIKKLDDNQIIYLKTSSRNGLAAIIKKMDVANTKNNKKENDAINNHIQGLISALFLQKNQNNIIVAINVYDHNFTLSLKTEQISNLGLYPGKKIFIRFDPDDVEWI